MANANRRRVILGLPATGLMTLGLLYTSRRSDAVLPAQPDAKPWPDAPAQQDPAWPGFPKQDPSKVSAVVGAAHRDLDTVRDLVDRHPALANAWWDWGFGDWESALGAAAHTGRRPIAEYLISRGARVDIFAATMLGWVDVVRGLIAASPGIERTPGPHGITLLNHARAGGEAAKPVLDFLHTLPGADEGPVLQPLSPDDLVPMTGLYSYGPREAHRFTLRVEKSAFQFLKPGNSPIRLHHLGGKLFFPAGVPAVRFSFNGAASVAIVDHDLRIEATRIG